MQIFDHFHHLLALALALADAAVFVEGFFYLGVVVGWVNTTSEFLETQVA